MTAKEIIWKQTQIIELMEKRFRIASGVEKVENKGLEMLSILSQIDSLKFALKLGQRNSKNPD